VNTESGLNMDVDMLLNRLDPLKTNLVYFSPTINLLSSYFVKHEDEESLSLI